MKKLIVLFLVYSQLAAFGQPQGKLRSGEVQIAVFLACECPISQKYVAKLNTIYNSYRHHSMLTWRFIVPEHASRKVIRSFIQEFNVKFPLKRDRRRQSYTEYFSASTTPQVIIVSDSVIYRGAVDNWFYELGKYRQKATEDYLIEALEAVIRQQAPKVRETEAVGCPIATSKRRNRL